MIWKHRTQKQFPTVIFYEEDVLGAIQDWDDELVVVVSVVGLMNDQGHDELDYVSEEF